MPNPSLSCSRLAVWTLAAVLLQILGLSLFVIGFFPIKPTLPGFSGPESYQMPTCDAVDEVDQRELPSDELRSVYRALSKIPPMFDRLILMVVDGLPAEFVLGRGDRPPPKDMMEAMPYTQSLLFDGRARGYHAKAVPPTVTMPRLKAMVSGAIGGFLDVAFNFNTQALLDDNIIDQFYRIGWKMVMLGDETWIKMFPGLFARQDGVSSFYVKDTVEVDFNVSRHLEVELATNDWNLLVLHYLGLDHIGHIGGRGSKLMVPKLREMDEVIKTIHMHHIQHPSNFDRRSLLMVLSDHGMTEGGNHGGFSYEETDSLALFIGLKSEVPDYAPSAYNEVFQVDMAPTLAILFGVPIPKNNVGVLMAEIFDSFEDEQRLRALELNSWQLLRLLQAHLPGMLCSDSPCTRSHGHALLFNRSTGSTKENICNLYTKAVLAQNFWKHHQGPPSCMSNASHDLNVAIESHREFLRIASEWLSHRATDKPVGFLAFGISLLLISCILLVHLLLRLFQKVCFAAKDCYSGLKLYSYRWQLDEAFLFLGILIHVMSLGSSSMVEEEQYTWHFLTSTLYLIFLFKTVKSLLGGQPPASANVVINEKHTYNQFRRADRGDNTILFNHISTEYKKNYHFNGLSSALVVLICGRILRGWHQGGVNWSRLSDIAKWLERNGTFTMEVLQIISLLLVMILSSFCFCSVSSRKRLLSLVIPSHVTLGLLVFLHILGHHSHNGLPMDHGATSVAQIFFVTLGLTVIVILIASPWILPIRPRDDPWMIKPPANPSSFDSQVNTFLQGIQEATHVIGLMYIVLWCLLQLLLQQPVNAVPVFLLFLQLLASIIYFSSNGSHYRQWTEVAAMHFLGLAGHFGLGNSNSLATIDVAGAFIGMSSYSTMLSGILMFVITYASPIQALIGMVMCISLRDMKHISDPQKFKFSYILQIMIAFPCLLPLVLNSIVLTAFTIILFLMRNHLFIWSVFSPKYLYICAATVSVYFGICIVAVTVVYISTVFFYRTMSIPEICNSSTLNK